MNGDLNSSKDSLDDLLREFGDNHVNFYSEAISINRALVSALSRCYSTLRKIEESEPSDEAAVDITKEVEAIVDAIIADDQYKSLIDSLRTTRELYKEIYDRSLKIESILE